MNRSQAFESGRRARRHGYGITQAPHCPDCRSPAWYKQAWRAGWSAEDCDQKKPAKGTTR